jgi:ATP-dependent Clp protease ATP-binding subunit ClpB
MDASNLLKPALARGELHCVGATTLDEYRKHVEKDAALARRFQPVFVSEPTVEDTVSILRGLKEKYEQHHGVRITDSALVAAATLSNRYITDRFLPDKAIDLVDEAASRLRMQVDSKPEELDNIDREIVRLKIEAEALKKETDAGLQGPPPAPREGARRPRGAVGRHHGAVEGREGQARPRGGAQEEARRRPQRARPGAAPGPVPARRRARLRHHPGAREGGLRDRSPGRGRNARQRQRPHGRGGDAEPRRRRRLALDRRAGRQDARGRAREAPQDGGGDRAPGRRAARSRRGGLDRGAARPRRLQDPNRPIGSFMFLGPTGVGKTELTKALAQFLFDDEHALVRIDMSEYMEKHSVARLIGAPPGTSATRKGGALTEAVRGGPTRSCSSTRSRRAHPDVFNILLQVLDDGRLTDGRGRTVDFRNVLIVMTSNLGSEFLVNQPEGQDTDAVRDEVMNVVRGHFRPEFLNRVDEIILFHRLQRSEMGAIVDIQMTRLQKLLDERKITLVLEPEARAWLAEKGYDPAYGARPLKRVIQKHVQDPLAEAILAGEIHDGETVPVRLGPLGLIIGDTPTPRAPKEAPPAGAKLH